MVFYGTSGYGGASGRGTVFRFLPSDAGIALETLHSFPVDFVSGEIVEAPDALYVPTYRPVAGYVTGAIYRITRGATPTVSVFVEIRADGGLHLKPRFRRKLTGLPVRWTITSGDVLRR